MIECLSIISLFFKEIIIIKENIGKIIVGGNHKDIVYEIKDSGCYEVISHKATGNAGYFKIKIDGILYDIHRWYYMKMHPEIDMTNLDVRHKCDNRHCINLEHLEHGTRKDNVNDMLVRNRQNSELTRENVIDIVNQYNIGGYRYIDLAKIYNVSDSTIEYIFTGKTWSHVTGIIQNDYKLLTQKSLKQSNEKYIFWDKYNNKWRVKVSIGKTRKHIGRYENLEDAIIARNKYLIDIY